MLRSSSSSSSNLAIVHRSTLMRRLSNPISNSNSRSPSRNNNNNNLSHLSWTFRPLQHQSLQSLFWSLEVFSSVKDKRAISLFATLLLTKPIKVPQLCFPRSKIWTMVGSTSSLTSLGTSNSTRRSDGHRLSKNSLQTNESLCWKWSNSERKPSSNSPTSLSWSTHSSFKHSKKLGSTTTTTMNATLRPPTLITARSTSSYIIETARLKYLSSRSSAPRKSVIVSVNGMINSTKRSWSALLCGH